MRNSNLRFFLSTLTVFSFLFITLTKANAAPVQFRQVTQIINAKPGKAANGSFTRLRLSDGEGDETTGGDDVKPVPQATPPQDGRVITETRTEIVEDDVCDCDQPPKGGGFPYPLLGLAALPLLFLIPHDKDETPTPTPPTTPTPPMTPSPTPPEPVPEPMTILLFGTGLAGIGMAARRKFGRRKEEDEEE